MGQGAEQSGVGAGRGGALFFIQILHCSLVISIWVPFFPLSPTHSDNMSLSYRTPTSCHKTGPRQGTSQGAGPKEVRHLANPHLVNQSHTPAVTVSVPL